MVVPGRHKEKDGFLTDSRDAAAEPSQPPAAQRRPLKILIGADTFAPNVNGAARFAERLAAGLVERGHEVHVMAPAAGRRHGTWYEEHDGRRMVMHRLPSYQWPGHWLRFSLPWTIKRRSGRVLDAVKPDVVHFQSHFVVGRGLSVEARRRGIRVIATNHFMPENLIEFAHIPRVLREFATNRAWRDAARILTRAEAVTTPTKRAAEFLEQNTGLKRVYAVSCGIDAHKYTPSFQARTGNRILFVGRVTGEKQIDVLVRAVSLLPDDLDVTLEIVGDGDQRKALELLAERLGVANRVTFTGYLSDDELRKAYSRATVLAMPSIAELQSIVTMEAMASALPVVAADAMALPHLVHDGENGYLFEPGNAQELADKLENIFRMSEDELTAMKKESLRIVATHDIERTLNTFECLYRGEAVPGLVVDGVTPAPAD